MANGTIIPSIPIDVTGAQPFEKVGPNGLKASDVQVINTKGKIPQIH
jgi:hypothetical protein